MLALGQRRGRSCWGGTPSPLPAHSRLTGAGVRETNRPSVSARLVPGGLSLSSDAASSSAPATSTPPRSSTPRSCPPEVGGPCPGPACWQHTCTVTCVYVHMCVQSTAWLISARGFPRPALRGWVMPAWGCSLSGQCTRVFPRFCFHNLHPLLKSSDTCLCEVFCFWRVSGGSCIGPVGAAGPVTPSPLLPTGQRHPPGAGLPRGRVPAATSGDGGWSGTGVRGPGLGSDRLRDLSAQITRSWRGRLGSAAC